MKYFWSVLFFVCDLYLISSLTYYFQVKDYMPYRFLAWIKEKSIQELIFPDSLLLPAKTLRNLVVAMGGVFLVACWMILGIVLDWNILYFGLFSILLSLASVFLMILITNPLAENKRKKLVEEAKLKIADSEAEFIGITGSFGKSSTKEFLTHILKSKYKVAKTIENYNTLWGVAISINKNLKKDTDFFVTEIGAYQQGNIEEVAQIIKPKYAILTGLGNQHVALFGSRSNLISAKKELLLSLAEDATAYVNMDSDGYQEAISGLSCKVVSFSSKNKKADVFLKESEIQEGKMKATIVYKSSQVRISVDLIGKHNLYNLLPCVALAMDLDIPIPNIQRSCGELAQVGSKLRIQEGKNESVIINDSYNSNLEGFLSAIGVLVNQKTKNKIIVTKGIIELGKEKEESYLKILESIYKNSITLVTTDSYFKQLDTREAVILIRGEKRLASWFKDKINSDTAILLEGRFKKSFLKFMGLNV